MNVYQDPEITIEETVGEAFVISLESLPTTGHAWKADYDTAAFELLRSRHSIPRTAGIGAGGDEEFEFRARRPGEATITMTYGRPWEKTSRKTLVFRLRITE